MRIIVPVKFQMRSMHSLFGKCCVLKLLAILISQSLWKPEVHKSTYLFQAITSTIISYKIKRISSALNEHLAPKVSKIKCNTKRSQVSQNTATWSN